MRTRRPPQAARALALSIAALAVAASCADDGATGRPNGDGSVASAPATNPSTSSAPAPSDDGTSGVDSNAADSAANVNATMLDIAAPLVGGGTLDLSTLGDRPVLLWFWAPF